MSRGRGKGKDRGTKEIDDSPYGGATYRHEEEQDLGESPYSEQLSERENLMRALNLNADDFDHLFNETKEDLNQDKMWAHEGEASKQEVYAILWQHVMVSTSNKQQEKSESGLTFSSSSSNTQSSNRNRSDALSHTQSSKRNRSDAISQKKADNTNNTLNNNNALDNIELTIAQLENLKDEIVDRLNLYLTRGSFVTKEHKDRARAVIAVIQVSNELSDIKGILHNQEQVLQGIQNDYKNPHLSERFSDFKKVKNKLTTADARFKSHFFSAIRDIQNNIIPTYLVKAEEANKAKLQNNTKPKI